MSIIVTWLGVSKPGATPLSNLALAITAFDGRPTYSINDECDPEARRYFEAARSAIRDEHVGEEEVRAAIIPISTPVQDFSKRYAVDEAYRRLVATILKEIMEQDVSAIALNPVFGSLWRTVCNNRRNEARDDLITKFGAGVQAITNEGEKQRMKAWLDESYDHAADVVATINEVAEPDRYPCVFLDPTLDWSTPTANQAMAGKGGEPSSHPSNMFTRDELLEIGRSCDFTVLRRLGKVLTRLTYIASRDELPRHVEEAPMSQVPRIPLALAEAKYERLFWKILLHLILPGTKLVARPAALLAALSIRMGIKPLLPAADAEMIGWAGDWNTLDIPETWNTNCLSLILDADRDFEKRRAAGDVAGDIEADATFLHHSDRRLFTKLVDYMMLKANMKTTLQAKVGWTPDKTAAPIGHLVVCGQCEFPRSVTMMSKGGVCGLCVPSKEAYQEYNMNKDEVLRTNVCKGQTEKDEAAWVECRVPSCRAQYVVYQVDALKARSKCYYCRQNKGPPSSWGPNAHVAPTVQYRRCRNRVIWPEEYRPAGFFEHEFQCPACATGRDTIVEAEMTALDLARENETDWLLRDLGRAGVGSEPILPQPFAERSLYKTVLALGDNLNAFVQTVQILPQPEVTDVIGTPALRLHGKEIHNPDAIQESLRGWIASRRAEAGTCSLCFAGGVRKRELRPACGRSGCRQTICEDCRRDWYGFNRRGRILNTAALSCPFCRRQPTPGAVSAVRGLRDLGVLRAAVEGDGSWVFAWCADCGLAKPFAEHSCTRGVGPDVDGWLCEPCRKALRGVDGTNRQRRQNCPGCGILTEKMAGCDHICCSICGAHWCYLCGVEVGEDKIYTHVTELHEG